MTVYPTDFAGRHKAPLTEIISKINSELKKPEDQRTIQSGDMVETSGIACGVIYDPSDGGYYTGYLQDSKGRLREISPDLSGIEYELLSKEGRTELQLDILKQASMLKTSFELKKPVTVLGFIRTDTPGDTFKRNDPFIIDAYGIKLDSYKTCGFDKPSYGNELFNTGTDDEVSK